MEQCNNRRAFTLLELLIVIAILGILSVSIITAINVIGNLNKATLARAKTFSSQVENALSINQVGKWSFDDSANPGKDTSGWGNDRTLQPGTNISAGTCEVGFGKCLELDGVPDASTGYVNVDAHASAIPSGTNNITVTAWVKWDVVPTTTNDVIVAYGENQNNQGFLLQYSNDNNKKMGFHIFNVGNVFSGITPVADKWYHLVGTYDHSNVSFYLDGKFIKKTPATGNILIETTLRFGNEFNRTYNLDGQIDEVAIYNQTLFSYQIQQLYAQGLPRHKLAKQ